MLDDLLDGPRLVRLANAVGLKYPGMRTQSQRRPRILDDLVARAGERAATRAAIARQLQKEVRQARRTWNALTDDEKRARLEELSAGGTTNGAVGRHLWLSAGDGDAGEPFRRLLEGAARTDSADEAADAAEPDASASAESARRAEAKLQKKHQELQKKLARAESQLTRARDERKELKKDLVARKGELAEARLQVERLRGQLDSAQERVARAESGREPVEQALAKLARAVRRLSAEQKKLVHALEKPAPAAEAVAARTVEELTEPVNELRRDLAVLKRERKKEWQAHHDRVEQLAADVRALKRVARPPKAKPAPRRPRTAADLRVGVFIDVQNVYYGARRLKGKLDFDALMDAALLERRLIQATAYVVESKDIDQSSFIARLQGRGIDVRRKSLKVRADGSMKGNWDMELALDLLDAARELDVVVLVSGDGDFTSLVQRVKRIGPRVEVIGFPRNTAKSLQEAADRYQPLDRKFMIYPQRKPGPDEPAADGAPKA